MNDKELNKLIKKIQKERVEYTGVINFASKGIMTDTEGLLKAFKYGVAVGVECTKIDVIRILMECNEET